MTVNHYSEHWFSDLTVPLKVTIFLVFLEYPLGKPRLVVTIIFQALLWCIFGCLFHLIMKDYFVNIKSDYSRFQLGVISSYYPTNHLTFFICVLVSLYNSEVINIPTFSIFMTNTSLFYHFVTYKFYNFLTFSLFPITRESACVSLR